MATLAMQNLAELDVWRLCAAELGSKELRREVRAVRPHERVKLLVQREAPKGVHIVQWLEDRAVKIIGEVYISNGTVVKAKPNAVLGEVAGIYETRQLHVHSKGSILGSGFPVLARAQDSSNSTL